MKAGDLDVTDVSITVGLAMASACLSGMKQLADELRLPDGIAPAAMTSALASLIEVLAIMAFEGDFEETLMAIRAVNFVHQVARPPHEPPH